MFHRDVVCCPSLQSTPRFTHKSLCLIVILLMVGFAMAAPAHADNDRNQPLVILDASVSGTTLTINGANFGTRPPTVRIKGAVVPLQSATQTTLVATAPALPPGTYLLT